MRERADAQECAKEHELKDRGETRSETEEKSVQRLCRLGPGRWLRHGALCPMAGRVAQLSIMVMAQGSAMAADQKTRPGQARPCLSTEKAPS
jgi:hypothetical protein